MALCIEVLLLSLCLRNVSDGYEQASVVEPIDPAEGGQFQILHVAPWPLAIDQLGFVEAVNRLGEAVVVAATNAAGRWFDASFGRSLCVSNG